MKSNTLSAPLADAGASAPPREPLPHLIAATANAVTDLDLHPQEALARARAFAQPLLASEALDSGENTLAHADAVALILKNLGSSEIMQAAIYLVHACPHLTRPEEVIAKAFSPNFAQLAIETTKLIRVQRQAREAYATRMQMDSAQLQTENVRKMLLAFSRDLRVVLLRLASRLQTMRYHAATKLRASPAMARETMQVFAPLANRLGIWQIKWELEDLAFRELEPDTYRDVAHLLDGKRVEREAFVEQVRARLQADLRAQGIQAKVSGRPKHIYSIVKKMRGKSLPFDQVYDLHALRVIVPSVKDCYATLSWVHSQYQSIEAEFDDYIARPKPNGYQSLHTVVRDKDGRAIEIQIRSQAMHDHAESGVAAHWAYKEAGTKGYAGVSAASDYDAKIAVLRQLLAWERDLAGSASHSNLFEDRIYVLTPDAAVIELPQGATPVDFAYAVHTSVGHRCRGAKVDGAMVPLNTPLRSGQTVEVNAAKEGGPSLDWLNADLGYLQSPRSKAKVRGWFNARAQAETVARGREAVEKLLQREGKTALKLDDLAAQLGFRAADALFELVGKDEFSLRNIELLLRPAPPPTPDEVVALKRPRIPGETGKGGVLVVGVESLLTTLARCCRPAPPDAISGYVTRGRGVAIHRSDCVNFRQMSRRTPERAIPVEWGTPRGDRPAVYPVDVVVEAGDRQGLLRDISEVFSKEKMNVIGVKTQSMRDAQGGTAWMTFTIEVTDSSRLPHVLGQVMRVGGVRAARRR